MIIAKWDFWNKIATTSFINIGLIFPNLPETRLIPKRYSPHL
jgi:hypothetical protein